MGAAESQSVGRAGDRVEPLLIGRERELEDLETALAAAQEGHGRAVLIAGEPGIGKTRLVEVVAERAEGEGALVLWGRCWENGGGTPFWPWVQVLRRLVAEQSDDDLLGDLGTGIAWVAQIVPELRERFQGFDSPGALESDQARFALFDAIAALLRNASRRQPLAIVLDDIHAADQASLLLLEFIVRATRQDRILIQATYQEALARQRAETEHLIGTIGRDSKQIMLRGFGESELTRLIEATATGPASEHLVHALQATTEGNPFYASELLRLLAAEGQLELWLAGTVRARFPLPDTVRETVRRRFDVLGERRIEILETAAVIGREFRLATLERATGAKRSELLDVADEAVAAGLVTEVPGAVGRFRFSHGLIRDTLYSGLPTGRRMRLHAGVGCALEHAYGDDPEHLPELAHHFAEAAPAGDAATALDYSIRAGRHAMSMLGYEQAAELFELALTISELLDPDPERSAELLLELGEARARVYDPAARETLIDAAEAARAQGRADLIARAALGVRAFGLGAGVPDQALLALFEEGLERIDDVDGPLGARLLARQAVALYYLPATSERRATLVDRAVAIARGLDDRATLAYVLSNAQLGIWGPDTTEQCLAWSEELLQITQQTGDVELELVARHRQVDFLLELDDVAGADIAAEALVRLAADSPDPRAHAYVALNRARRALLEGGYVEAERFNAEAAAESARVGDPTIEVLVSSQAFGIRWSQGREGELETQIRRYAASAPGMPAWRAGLAVVCRSLGREEQVRREFDRLAANGFDTLPRDNDFLLTLALLSEVCAYLGDAPRARELYDLLVPFEARNAVAPHAFVVGPVSRYLGLLAATVDDRELAAGHFRAASAAAAALNARPISAQVCLDEADMLTAAGGFEEHERALELIREATQIANELDSSGVADRIKKLEQIAEPDASKTARVAEASTRSSPQSASLTREGDVWTFEWDGHVVRMRDSKGVRYLGVLLASPGVEIHATALAAGPADRPAHQPPTSGGLEGPAADDAGPVLDSEAKASYRARLEDLEEELAEAEAFNDPERSARARAEIELIAGELAGAVGLGGRDRKLGSVAERARVNVTRAIRGVLKRIVEHDPDLGRELSTTVRTGTFCAYEPDPRAPVVWQVKEN